MVVIAVAAALIAYAWVIGYIGLLQNRAVGSSDSLIIDASPGASIGVFGDSGCTQPLTSIAWGNVTVGRSTSYQLWVKNTGLTSVTLSMGTSGWSPANAAQYITVGWNLNETVLLSNQAVMANLTLTVSPNTPQSITSFSTHIAITCTD